MNSTENISYTDRLVRTAAAHPYICTLLICIFINPFFFGAIENIPENALMLEVLITSGFTAAAVYAGYRKGKLSLKQSAAVGIVGSGAALCLSAFYADSANRGLWHFAGGCALTAVLYWLSDRRKYNVQMNSFLIMGTGFFLKLYYVLGTSVYTRQHDVSTFEGGDGHAGYISYLINNFHLPDFDVRDAWQFCHPPLHHTIAAAWIYISNTFFMVNRNHANESIQMLTLFYSMCIIISAYKIFRYFNLKGAALYIPLAVVSFHPAYILYSGSINNDVLSAALVTGAVVSALEWYREQTVKNIVRTALCIGLGMMAKLTAALVAPAVAVIFLVVFIKNIKTDWKKLIMQFALFAVICCPLGLGYEIRNYVKWEVPVTYVQELPAGLLQNIGGMEYSDRITDFSPEQFKSVYEQWLWHDDSDGQYKGYNEHNPLIALMKNSLFGEYINESSFGEAKAVNRISVVFFWTNAVIAAAAFAAMLASVFMKGRITPLQKAFFLIFYFSMIFNFYKMAYDYPFTCTLNFRYITPTVIVPLVCSGVVFDSLRTGKPKFYNAVKYTAGVLSGVFAVCSSLVYLSLCYNR